MSFKSLLLFSSLCLVAFASPANAETITITEDGVYKGWQFELNSDGTTYSLVSIDFNYYNESECPEDVTIPTSIKSNGKTYEVSGVVGGQSVAGIEAGVFSSTKIKTVTIPNGIKTIGSSAFSYCTGLTEVTFTGKSQITSIGDYAFQGCKSLTSINLPEGITEIGQSAFYMCEALESITLPSTLKTIGSSAFKQCTSLDGVILPAGLETISSYAFCQCKSLSSITIPASVNVIGQNAFQYCYSIASVTIEDNEENQDRVIEAWAFNQCNKITSITIPSSITRVESNAFTGCDALEEIVIADGVDEIQAQAFDSCNKLLKVKFEAKEFENLPSFKSDSFTWWRTVQNNFAEFVVPEDADYTIVIDKNGGTVSANKKTTDPTAIKDATLAGEPVAYYSLTGAKIAAPKAGSVVIATYSDGTARKLVVK